ncbi:acid protease [Sparassis latifolia]|uniref:Probable aspartic-type endopeptidase n=1 Tax=Sparassis crispa TaxID=139825 RepID=A0A401H1F2_9APHY|nr:Probable aspartic-type endopeptidase [Sparassis crispa]GBE88244.1 Probable aspartic-type endopeptidase [Sparassis crispa]
MQLVLSLTALLATLSMTLSLSGEFVQARPTEREVRLVTLPLKRVHQARTDIHPQVFLQQHINRGLKRYARMTGRMEPSPRELEEKLHKRMYIPPTLRHSRHNKRFNRGGLPSHATVEVVEAEDVIVAHDSATGKNKSANKKGNSTTGASASAPSASASQGGAGIPEVDVQAAENGGLTAPENPTANNSLGLSIEANDVGYIATIQMGTPPRDFKILMDSGSADLWVGSENCQTEGTNTGCGNHTFLGSQSSSTFIDTGKQFEVTYGTGQVQGDIVTDNINVAGLALNNHTFGVANVESTDFSSDTIPFDGLMGLAKSNLSEEQTPTPVESLAQAGLISEAITSFKISRLSTPPNDGEVTFGGLDTTKFNASTLVTFANVNAEGFWEGNMTTVTSNGQDLGLTGRTAILDTGTTLIIAPEADATAVHQTIPGAQSDGQGGFTIPCTSNTTIALSFGGESFAINPVDLLFTPVDVNNLQGNCVSGISSGQIGTATEWLLGDVFLKNVYFSVNVNKNEISLAKLV